MVAFSLAFLSLATFTAAQYYNESSYPFRLILQSDNTTLNGTALGACHQGAAIEGLCRTSQRLNDTASSYTRFYHNVSSSDPANADDVPGILGWDLFAGRNLTVPSAMKIQVNLASNIGIPIFSPGWADYSLVAFDECDEMYIQSYQDDTVTPPAVLNPAAPLKSWYVCLTTWGYTYETLVWKVGQAGEPQNPSCQKVEVKRVFIRGGQ